MGTNQRNRWYPLIAFGAAFIASVGVRAEDVPTGLQIVPKWAMVATADGQRACYDKDGARKLIVIDGQLVVCRAKEEELLTTRDLNKALEERADAQAAIIRSLRDQLQIAQTDAQMKKTEAAISLGFFAGVIGFTAGVLTTIAILH
jgi:hypothetical protein